MSRFLTPNGPSDVDRKSSSSSPESSDYHASDESDHSPPVSPTSAGATAQSVKCRAIDLDDSSSTDDDKLSISDLLGPLNYDDSAIGTEQPERLLQNEYKTFPERHSEGSNDELLPPKIVVQKEDDTIIENLKSEIERLRNEKTAIEEELKKENAGLKAQMKQLQDENSRLKQQNRPPLKELRKDHQKHGTKSTSLQMKENL